MWLAKEEIGLLFERDRSVISRHISNIFEEGELSKETSCAKNAHELNGQRYYTEYFNLDIFISIGYRVKSQRGIIFRKWAREILKEYSVEGSAINKERCLRCENNYLKLQEKTYLKKKRQMDLLPSEFPT